MGFRENCQHMRTAHNMTQEQLAMLLGVSRQSVNKWEAGKAYPELEKLVKLCDLFGCSLDELVRGDVTCRDEEATAWTPLGGTPQDVSGYDEAARSYAARMAMGIAALCAVESAALLLAGLFPSAGFAHAAPVVASAAALVGLAIGTAIILPARFRRKWFFKDHPFVEDFYTSKQKRQADIERSTGLAIGALLVVSGAVVAFLTGSNAWVAGGLFVLLAGLGVSAAAWGLISGGRCDLDAYNRKALGGLSEQDIDAMDDGDIRARAERAKRVRSVCTVIMLASTALALVLLFVPPLHAQSSFWVPWAVGGIGCCIARARLYPKDGN
ncbi:helix-turn-helix transcriptional regulator [Collinsella sp. An2]|uniref:helix-turn-helix transcriptional regulator n=1 Tax=Collinsella sp. An2 TaxID=1965585 RepID=UPI00130218D9|nr:helix-turn-helix transcriptional regulator [Collinsella sp. An2]